jgi:hypothetical protein
MRLLHTSTSSQQQQEWEQDRIILAQKASLHRPPRHWSKQPPIPELLQHQQQQHHQLQ